MRRLYQKIYLTIIASLVLVVLIAGAIWRFGAGGPPAVAGVRDRGRAGRRRCCRRPSAPQSAQQQAIDRPRRSGCKTDLALFDRARRTRSPRPDGRCRRRRATARAAGSTVAAGRPGASAAGRPLVRRPRAGRGTAHPCDRPDPVSRRHRARRRARRLSGRARPDAAARAAAGRRRDARRRQPFGARQGRGQGRGGAARRELQPRRRRASRSWSDAHRMLLANASHELRTPLSRIRLGVELLDRDRRPEIQGEHRTATSPSSTR